MPNLGGWELVVLLGVLVLIFGAKRLPDMARSIGQSARVFKGEISGLKNDHAPDDTNTDAATVAEPAPPISEHPVATQAADTPVHPSPAPDGGTASVQPASGPHREDHDRNAA